MGPPGAPGLEVSVAAPPTPGRGRDLSALSQPCVDRQHLGGAVQSGHQRDPRASRRGDQSRPRRRETRDRKPAGRAGPALTRPALPPLAYIGFSVRVALLVFQRLRPRPPGSRSKGLSPVCQPRTYPRIPPDCPAPRGPSQGPAACVNQQRVRVLVLGPVYTLRKMSGGGPQTLYFVWVPPTDTSN